MNWKMSVLAFAGVLILGGLLNWQVSENQKLADKNTSLTKEKKSLSDALDEQKAITTDYEKRIDSLHELDTKHTTELTNAKAKIDQLRIDVSNGTKRVYVNAKCPKPESSSTSGVDAGRSPTLEGDTREDYFNLLKQLETLEKQFLGLRDWYFAECKR
ncbi:lysis protein [Providencia sp.]|uniref:lysis protein n=1 Tax=Providencia sp. TaxID=589 RepID=UPI003F95EA99